MMKIAAVIILGLIFLMGGCGHGHSEEINSVYATKLVNCIYVVEGGRQTRWSYGVKSVKTTNPRQVCLNTIKNNWIRWNKTDKSIPFLEFLANRYCPESCDKIGHKNWLKNMQRLIKE